MFVGVVICVHYFGYFLDGDGVLGDWVGVVFYVYGVFVVKFVLFGNCDG